MARKKKDPAANAESRAVSRRDALKLGGLVASLGAGLGAVLDPAEGQGGATSLKASPAVVQFKFFRMGVPGMPMDKMAPMVGVTTIKWDPRLVRVLQAERGALQVKIYLSGDPHVREAALIGQGVISGGMLQDKTRPGGGLLQDKQRPGGGLLQQKGLPDSGGEGE